MNTEAMPGMAFIRPSTTRRRDGTTETTRSNRRMRRARRTERPWALGTREIATMMKSKTFQPDRKNPPPRAMSLSAISTMKMPRQILSSVRISGPAAAMSVLEVSIPRMIALKRITPRMRFWIDRLSMNAPMRARKPCGVSGVVSGVDWSMPVDIGFFVAHSRGRTLIF